MPEPKNIQYRNHSPVPGMNTKNELARSYPTRTMAAQQKAKRRKMFIIVAIVALIIAVAVAVIVPVILTRKKDSSSSGSSQSGSSGGGGGGGGSGGSSGAITGKSGSRITMEDGTTFTYTNDFGGDWSADPKHPFGVGGKPQSWGKRIGQDEWVWGQDIAYGVNLG